MDMTFFLTKDKELIVDENGYVRGPTRTLHLLVLDKNGYVRGPTRILHLLVLDENGYELFSSRRVAN